MSPQDFKTHIKEIRKEAIEIGFSVSTMDDYLRIWNQFILWKQEEHFIYNEEDYSKFLLEYYQFDVSTYTTQSKSGHQRLMRSKRILEDFDSYKNFMTRAALPRSLFCDFPKEWNPILENYLVYCKDVRNNRESSIKVKKDYLTHLLSYFSQKNIQKLQDLTRKDIITFINEIVDKGNVSKRRNFYVLREFLNYLFIEDILKEDYSILVPSIKKRPRIRIPTYLKEQQVEELLESIPKERNVEKRDYTILLIAARLGLRLHDILNIKLKDIDWQAKKITVLQTKNQNVNVLPLTNEVGWAIIHYIKEARPICKNEYLFVKHKYPYEQASHLSHFGKYFETIELETSKENKKGIHNLRHSLATNMLNHEIPLPIIASTLGDSIEITSKTYLKVDEKRLKECVLEVEEDE